MKGYLLVTIIPASLVIADGLCERYWPSLAQQVFPVSCVGLAIIVWGAFAAQWRTINRISAIFAAGEVRSAIVELRNVLLVCLTFGISPWVSILVGLTILGIVFGWTPIMQSLAVGSGLAGAAAIGAGIVQYAGKAIFRGRSQTQ